jgi:hypothetical protein
VSGGLPIVVLVGERVAGLPERSPRTVPPSCPREARLLEEERQMAPTTKPEPIPDAYRRVTPCLVGLAALGLFMAEST